MKTVTYRLTQAFRHDAALIPRVHHPVVVLERVHGLQYGGHPSHVRVDLRVREELGGQVRVQPGLHVRGRVYPQARVEQYVIE